MKPWLKWTLWIVGGLVGLLVLVVLIVVLYVNASWNKPSSRRVPAMTASSSAESIKRGEYLFRNTLQCWGCHSPKLDANSPASGGREFDLRNVGPGFGLFYAPNITPDQETGIGSWNDGEIVRALREGIRKDGTTLFPIMPIEAMKGLSDDDALAIVAYLRSRPAVKHEVKKRELTFVAKALFAFGMIGPEKQIDSRIETPSKKDRLAWGRYLANNASTCMDCHTPRNLQDGSFYRDSIFAGSTIAFGEDEKDPGSVAFARNITFDKETGIGNWTEEQFFNAVRVGMRPDGTVLSPHMPYSYIGLWEDDDVRAVFEYLKTVPAHRRTTVPPKWSEVYQNGKVLERGKVIFKTSCEQCHGEDAKGAAPTRVVLADVAQSMNDKTLREFISAGNVGLRMPSFAKSLSPEQIDDVIAYLRTVEKKW